MPQVARLSSKLALGGRKYLPIPAPAPTYTFPWGFALSNTAYVQMYADNNDYLVTLDNNGYAYSVDPLQNTNSVFATGFTGGNWSGMPGFVDYSGNVYTGNNYQLFKINAANATADKYTASGSSTGPAAAFGSTSGPIITFGRGTSDVYSITTSNSITRLTTNPVEGALVYNAAGGTPAMTVVDSNGNIYWVGAPAYGAILKTIAKINSSGTTVATWTYSTSYNGYTISCCDSNNNIYYTSPGSPYISRITADGVFNNPWVTLPSNNTGGLCVGYDGNIYAPISTTTIAQITSTGTINSSWLTITGASLGSIPGGVNGLIAGRFNDMFAFSGAAGNKGFAKISF